MPDEPLEPDEPFTPLEPLVPDEPLTPDIPETLAPVKSTIPSNITLVLLICIDIVLPRPSLNREGVAEIT